MATIIREIYGPLSTLVRQPHEGKAGRIILFLHGWGSNGEDLMGLSGILAAEFPDALFLAPDGPEPCSAHPAGRQWFPLDIDQASIDAGPAQAHPHIENLIESICKESGLGHKAVTIIGFSQGGMMALHTASRLASEIQSVISFSGALLAPKTLAEETASKPPILLVHGQDDDIVPFQAMALAEGVLRQEGFSVKTIARQGLGHGIDQEGVTEAISFMKNPPSA